MDNGYKQNYLRGLLTEALVAMFLESQGYTIETSTTEENIKHDIDLYLDGVPTSIKCQDKGVNTGNFSFELEQQLGIKHPELPGEVGQWVRHQGFHCSGADTYAIVQGNDLYVISKYAIQRHVKRHGWDRVTTLSQGVKGTQEGRMYVDARNGLIAREKLRCDITNYLLPQLLLSIRDDLVYTCLAHYVDFNTLRDLQLMMGAYQYLEGCYSRQEDRKARLNIMRYTVQGLTLVA